MASEGSPGSQQNDASVYILSAQKNLVKKEFAIMSLSSEKLTNCDSYLPRTIAKEPPFDYEGRLLRKTIVKTRSEDSDRFSREY